MNNKALGLSVVMAVFAMFIVLTYVKSVEDVAKKKFGTEVLVVVAKQDIKEMETINETLLELKPVPKSFLEPASISMEKTDDEVGTKRTIKGLAGTVAIVPIKKGEQLTFNKLTEPNMRTGLAPQITPGKRAISIPVNEFTGVSKLVKPGDRVDIINVFDGGGAKENKIAKTILQDVVVLSIGRYITNNAARVLEADNFTGKEKVRNLSEDFSFASITVEVDPSQAQLLTLILGNSDNFLNLVLRNNDDVERTNISATVLNDVLGPDVGKLRPQQAVKK